MLTYFGNLTQDIFELEEVSKICPPVLIPRLWYCLKPHLQAVPPKDAGGNAFFVEADVSHKILDFCSDNFSPIAARKLTLKSLDCQ